MAKNDPLPLDGLILESRHAEYQYIVKGPLETNWQDGFPREQPKHIVLEFDDFICMLDDQAFRKEWTDEDKLYIGRALERAFRDNEVRAQMWIHEKPRPPLPWPKYNETHHKQIPQIAAATGTVAEAIRYENERDGGPRVEVIQKLTELLNGEVVVEVDEDLAAV